MQKVCLKIPGVSKPHSIMGEKLFEDERYLVIIDSNIRRKIPWENILYIEDIVGYQPSQEEPQAPLNQAPVQGQPPATVFSSNNTDESLKAPRVAYDELKRIAQERRGHEAQSAIQAETAQMNRVNGATVSEDPGVFSDELVDAQVFFEGHKTGVFKVSLPVALLHGQWTPELSRHIFSNEQIRNFMGGFNVEKMELANGNVYIRTRSVSDEAIKSIETKMQMVGKIQASVANLNNPHFERPTMELDNTFAMLADPFDAPVSFIRQEKELEDVGFGEEERAGEEEDRGNL